MYRAKAIACRTLDPADSGRYVYAYYCLKCGNSVETEVEDEESPRVPWQKYVNFKNGYPNADGSLESEKCSNMQRKMIDSLSEALTNADEMDLYNIFKRIGGSNAPRWIKEIVTSAIEGGMKEDGLVADEVRKLGRIDRIWQEKEKRMFLEDIERDKEFEETIVDVRTFISIGYYGGYNLYMEARTKDGNKYKIRGCDVLPLGKIYKFSDLKEYIQPGSFHCAYRRYNDNSVRVVYVTWQWVENKADSGLKFLDPSRIDEKAQKLLSEAYYKNHGRFETVIYKP